MQSQGLFPSTCSILAIKFGAAPNRRDRVVSLKDELRWSAREAIRKGNLALPEDAEIHSWQCPRGSDFKAQVTSSLYTYDSADRIKVLDRREGNSEKTRTLPAKSPDLAHAMILGARYYLRQTMPEAVEEAPASPEQQLWQMMQGEVKEIEARRTMLQGDPYRRWR
jgi:hypothetical protein